MRPGQFGFIQDPDGDVVLQQGSLTVEENINVTGDHAVEGNLSVGGTVTLGDVEITATADEINILDGVTATADEINVLDGVTATADEINILDGCTATSGDLNNLLRGASTGKTLAFGVRETAAAQEDVPTGLVTVEAAIATMVGAPSLTHMWTRATVGNQTGQPAAGSIRINNTKPTTSGNVTQIDATSPFGYVAWIAIGTN